MSKPLAGRTILMSGGSRGIGLAIALRAARDGANVALLAKTDTPHPKLEGTVHTAAERIREAGGQALPIVGDVRDDDAIAEGDGELIHGDAHRDVPLGLLGHELRVVLLVDVLRGRLDVAAERGVRALQVLLAGNDHHDVTFHGKSQSRGDDGHARAGIDYATVKAKYGV